VSARKDRGLVADFGELERPGVYVLTERFEGISRKRVIQVVSPIAESSLKALGKEHREKLFPGAHHIRFESTSGALSEIVSVTVGSELKNYLLILLLALLVIEPLLANRTAFRRGRPSEGVREGGITTRTGAGASAS
jgi:hypothetical protein